MLNIFLIVDFYVSRMDGEWEVKRVSGREFRKCSIVVLKIMLFGLI